MVDEPGAGQGVLAHLRRRCVPAAASALFISPVAHAAMLGMIAITTATACAFGTSWKACAPISSPM